MKKYIIRAVGALCIVASLLLVFFPTWVKVDGVENRDLRDVRKAMTDDLEVTQNYLLEAITYSDFKEDLKDNNLPYTKSTIKNRIEETEKLVKELVNDDVSIKEVLWLSMEAPKYINDTDKLFDTYVAEEIFESSSLVYQDDIEDIVDSIKGFSFAFYLVPVFMFTFVLLGLVAAVTHVLNNARYIKYIFIPILIVVIVGVCVGASFASIPIEDVGMLADAEAITFKTTIMPYLAGVLALVPVVLDCVFETKKAKKEEE